MAQGPEPMVSVLCMVYNHERYVRHCLQAFVDQRTDHTMEVIVHDDASTDGSAAIVREFEARYPSLFTGVYQTTNQHGIERGRVTRLLYARARGKYIAFCEGDDHWTDPLKIQKQVDYLERNPQVVVACHDARIVDAEDRPLRDSKVPERLRKDATAMELRMLKSSILPVSMVFRNLPVLRALPYEFFRVVNTDNFLTVVLGEHGSAHFMPEVGPAVYRVHGGGIWSPRSRTGKKLTQLNTYLWMAAYQNRIGEPELAAHYIARANDSMGRLAVRHHLKFDPLYRAIARLARLFGRNWP